MSKMGGEVFVVQNTIVLQNIVRRWGTEMSCTQYTFVLMVCCECLVLNIAYFL